MKRGVEGVILEDLVREETIEMMEDIVRKVVKIQLEGDGMHPSQTRESFGVTQAALPLK